MKNKKKIHFSIFYALLILSITTMPFTKFLQLPIILLLFINFVAEWNWKEKIERIRRNGFIGISILFISFFLIYLIGLVYTTNIKYGLSSLECKLFFLVAPLVIFTSDREQFTRYRMSNLFYLFIFSNLLLVITNLIISTGHFIQNKHISIFFYSQLSHFMHPSYSAMYITVALAASIYFLFFHSQKTNKIIRKILWISLPFFTLYIFLLQSKAGLLIFLFLAFLFSLYLINFKRFSLLKTSLFILFLVSISYFSIFKIPSPYNRISVAIKAFSHRNDWKGPTDGTTSRIAIWKVSYVLGVKHLPLGVGTGDTQDALMEAYQKEKLKTAYDKEYNSHNQYLQLFLTLGIVGILLLLAYLFVPLIFAIKKKNIVYITFCLVIILNLLVESMLEARAGSNFIALFNSLFFFMTQIPEKPAPSLQENES